MLFRKSENYTVCQKLKVYFKKTKIITFKDLNYTNKLFF